MSDEKIAGIFLRIGKKMQFGAFYPRAFRRVQKRFRSHPERIWELFLDDLAHALRVKGQRRHPSVRMHVATSDRYHWTAAVSFTFMGVRCRVLIPMMHDSKKLNGSYSDRHVALFLEDVAGDEAFHERVALHFADHFVMVYEKSYESSIRRTKVRS